ncbi:hypothetical protein [Tabrizicola soli]|uniref:Uncharacterized protein n=1 Tax=Tabrizicola soli TaxID=2185115 RepID=A0ABV7E2G8_9RHOB|nr:hypothetical protein [Tabrizicola soli]
MTPIAILALTALTIGVGIIISLGLAKAITAYQDAQEAKAAKRQREADWCARRAAQWGAW